MPERQTAEPAPSILRVIVALPIALVAGAEIALRTRLRDAVGPVGRLAAAALAPYVEARAQALEIWRAHWHWLLPLAIITLVVAALMIRQALLFWHNTLVARLSGSHFAEHPHGFAKGRFDLRARLGATPAGRYFLGLDPAGKAVYLSEWDLDTHGHVMGHTGSGKTRSVLEPLMLQDMRYGKGVLFMDAKGSSENVDMMRALAAITRRTADLRVFALAHPDWSQTYNPVYLGAAGDPLAAAERVFSVFPLDNEYYRGQAKLFFYSLMRLLAGTGKAFNLVDVRLCVADDDILDYVSSLSDDRAAKYEICKQLGQLGKRRFETFTGLYNAIADYDHPLLQSYNPDIVIEEIMNERGIVYFNLPANRYALLAPAIGKIVLQHVKAVGALRQIDRAAYDQTPFAVNIDELNRFAFDELVPSLAMLRDAHVQFRLSHQSLGDLEQVSEVFAAQVRDNTRWKVFLFENDPDHLEKISRSFGTRTAYKKTVRFSLGPLFTFLNTGEVSNREVEEFVLHPNSLKSLAPQGQGYLLLPNRMTGVNFETLPRFAVPPLAANLSARRPAGDGLDLYTKFVLATGADGVEAEGEPAAEGDDDTGDGCDPYSSSSTTTTTTTTTTTGTTSAADAARSDAPRPPRRHASDRLSRLPNSKPTSRMMTSTNGLG